MPNTDDIKEISGSSLKLQQSSENQPESTSKSQEADNRKDDESEKISKLLGYCPRKLPSRRPLTSGSKGYGVKPKVSQSAQTSKDLMTKNAEKKSSENAALSQQPAQSSTQKGRNSEVQQQVDNNIGERDSDGNAGPISSSEDCKSDVSKGSVGNITESREDKDFSSPPLPDRCQENLLTNNESKRNKKGRVVPSRYMLPTKNVYKPRMQPTSSAASGRSAKKIVSSKRMVERINMNSTPAFLTDDGLPLQNSSKSQCTSTPAIHALPLPFSNDMSSIMGDASVPIFATKALLAPCNAKHQYNASTKETLFQKASVPSDAAPVKKKASYINPTEIMYCRYLQAVFLEAKAGETLKKKSQKAKEQLFSLWKKNQELMEIEANLDLELDALENQGHVNHHLERQEKYLEPLNEAVERLNSQYDDIAKALDTTRHQLPLSGIHLSDVNDLADALTESEKLSELLVTASCPSRELLVDFASCLSKIEETVEAEKKELHKCSDLAKKFESLTIQEASLLIQSIGKQNEQGQPSVSLAEISEL